MRIQRIELDLTFNSLHQHRRKIGIGKQIVGVVAHGPHRKVPILSKQYVITCYLRKRVSVEMSVIFPVIYIRHDRMSGRPYSEFDIIFDHTLEDAVTKAPGIDP